VTTGLRAARDALWPGGIMNPPRIPPTPTESVEIRTTAEIAALSTLPGYNPPRFASVDGRFAEEGVVGDGRTTAEGQCT
jgi:hypothetical protein